MEDQRDKELRRSSRTRKLTEKLRENIVHTTKPSNTTVGMVTGDQHDTNIDVEGFAELFELPTAEKTELTKTTRHQETEGKDQTQLILQLFQRLDEIKNSLDTQKSELKDEIQTQNNDLKKSLESKMDTLNKNLEQKIEQQSQQMAEIQNKMERQEQKITQMEQHTNALQDSLISGIQARFEEFAENTIIKCDEQIQQQYHTVTMDIETAFEQHKLEHQSTIKKLESDNTKIQNENEEIREKLHRNSDDIQTLNTEMNSLTQTTNEISERLVEINRRPQFNNSTLPNTIYITCNGPGVQEKTLPTFNGRSRNPIEFLERFKNYLQRMSTRQGVPPTNFEELLDVCLEQSAGRWWQMIRAETKTLQEFEERFINKYWHPDVQTGIRRRMEVEKYQVGGRKTRTEYFIERVLLMNNMTPKMTETDIISVLGEHFEQRIQDAKRVQNITTIREFEQLLTREDIDEQNSTIKYHNSYLTNRNNYKGETQNGQDKRDIHEEENRPYNKFKQYNTNKNKPRDEREYSYKPNYSPPHYQGYQQKRYGNRERDNNQYYHRNDRRTNQDYRNEDRSVPHQRYIYPTEEQAQVCQMIASQNEERSGQGKSPRTSPTPQIDQTVTSRAMHQQENC